MSNDLINKTIDFVKDFFANEYSGHDYFHTLRVYNIAKTLAEKENADVEICCLAALLHDVDDHKISPETYKEKTNATKFLKLNNYDEEKIKLICHIIDCVAFFGKDDSIVPDTLEGKIVQDADRLDALGAMGIARTFAYGGNHNSEIYNPDIKPRLNMNKDEYIANKSTSINHFYEKLLLLEDLMNTDMGKELAKARTEFIKNYLEEFFAEWNGEK